MYGYSEDPNDRYDNCGINDRPTVSKEPTDYIKEYKLHSSEKLIYDWEELIRYVDDCNKNDYRPI